MHEMLANSAFLGFLSWHSMSSIPNDSGLAGSVTNLRHPTVDPK